MIRSGPGAASLGSGVPEGPFARRGAVRQPARRVARQHLLVGQSRARPGISSTATNPPGCRHRCCGPSSARGLPTRCSRPAGSGRSSCIFRKGWPAPRPRSSQAAAETATNPAVRDAFVLAIIASEGPPAYPGLPGYSPDLGSGATRCGADRQGNGRCCGRSRPTPAAYVAESSFFQADWQRAYWGTNYQRLREVKRATIPTACSSSTMASAAKIGAKMASRELRDIDRIRVGGSRRLPRSPC